MKLEVRKNDRGMRIDWMPVNADAKLLAAMLFKKGFSDFMINHWEKIGIKIKRLEDV